MQLLLQQYVIPLYPAVKEQPLHWEPDRQVSGVGGKVLGGKVVGGKVVGGGLVTGEQTTLAFGSSAHPPSTAYSQELSVFNSSGHCSLPQ